MATSDESLMILMLYIIAFCKEKAPQSPEGLEDAKNKTRQYLLDKGLLENEL